MKLKRCTCRHCRRGIRRLSGKAIAKRAVRHGRRTVRDMIKTGDYENIPVAVSVPYTD